MVYLIHFEKKFKRTQHYLGFSFDPYKRLKRHKSGHGSKFLKAVNEAGINYTIIKVWSNGDKTFERKLKNQKNTKRFCLICKAKNN